MTCLCCITASAAAVDHRDFTTSVTIGSIQETFRSQKIEPGESLAYDLPSSTTPLLLRFIIPNDLEGHAFDVELRANGTIVSRRSGQTSGIGRRSILLPATGTAGPLEILNRATEPLLFQSLEPAPAGSKGVVSTERYDPFIMALLMPPEPGSASKNVSAFDQLTTTPGVQFAAGFELWYAKLGPEQLRSQLRWIRELCDEYHVKALISPCSWWGGTPREVFDRLDFQQVCWSPADNGAAADVLKELMGSRWSRNYGLTTPNMWSNCPWQTLNHPELNSLRSSRLKQTIPMVEEELRGKLVGYVSENEPAYWAWDASDYMYPVKRPNLWADFNPYTVADAKRDGIELDPSDGLSIRERSWLLENATRYIQRGIDDLNSCSPSAPVYSHALLEQHFPTQGTGHYRPYAEIARVKGARVGLELLRKANFDGMWRIREWGRWGCVNREENDGVAMDYHTGMLQLIYALGADTFHSYNWDSVNEGGRALQYFNDFLQNVRQGEIVVGERNGGDAWCAIGGKGIPSEVAVPLEVRYQFPWANELSLDIRADARATSISIWLTRGLNGPVVAWRNLRKEDVSSSGSTRLDLGDLLKVEQDDGITLHARTSEGGWEWRCSDDGPNYKLRCDLLRARSVSQWLIHHSASNQL